MTAADYTKTARHAFRSLLSGSPNGASPEGMGPWWQTYTILKDSFDEGGADAVNAAFNMLVSTKEGRGLAQLIAGEPAGATPKISACPPLPAAAAAVLEHTGPCAAWLDDYLDFATQAAPMTPRSFHEAAGLFLISTAIARRLVLQVSTTSIYPNLFALFIAPSTLYSKTTGFKLVTDLIEQAGLTHLILPQRMTPEAFVSEMGMNVSNDMLNGWTEQMVDLWLQERAFAAQRGWAIDEASGLFDSLKRDYNAGLLPLLLELYDCPQTKDERTISRGRMIIRDVYLSFFGAATPSALSEHLTNPTHWTNGLWARFAMVLPDEAPKFQFFPDQMVVPRKVIDGLRRVYTLFPVPTADLAYDERGEKKTKVYFVQVSNSMLPSTVGMEEGVWDAWRSYTQALRYDLLMGKQVDGSLHASYGRMGTLAIKVAMLLAAVDSTRLPVVISRRHFARAVAICERWRQNLHTLWTEGVTTQEAQLSDKVMGLLAQVGPSGLSTRGIYRPLGRASDEIRAILEELERAGMVEQFQALGENRRKVEFWRLASPEVSSVNIV